MTVKYLFMLIKTDHTTFFVFDLDDTLYAEKSYLKSAFRHIASELAPYVREDIYPEMLRRYNYKEEVFQWISERYKSSINGYTIEWMKKQYREHTPHLTLAPHVQNFLVQLFEKSIPAGLITDGRSITQRNKLKALGIEDYFSDLIISEEFGSEKPDENNYRYFINKYPGRTFYFIGDNTAKDFIVPHKLGWVTICIKDSGNNIHPQDPECNPKPQYFIDTYNDIHLC